MSDSDIRDRVRPAQPNPWDADAEVGHSDIRTPNIGFTSAAQWGLASLLIGCTLLIAGCVVLAFNVLLFRGGPAGIPASLAFAGGLIGTMVVAALGLASLLFGARSWQQAYGVGSSPALGVAGVAASFAGLVTWLIAAIDLIMILYSFN
jgi:hypothetical protein